MKRIALVPLLVLLSVPLAFQAHADDEERDETFVVQFDNPNENHWIQMIQDRTRGARLGVSVGEWADGPVEGISVTSVSPGGPAEQAGLKSGDLLMTINGEALAAENGAESYERLRNTLSSVEAGNEVTIGYRRGDEDLEVTVTTSGWEEIVPNRPSEWQDPRFAERVRSWANRMSNWNDGGRNIDVEVDVDEDEGQQRRIVRVRRRPVAPTGFYGMAWSLVGLQIAELTPELGEYFGTETGLLVVRGPDNEDIGLEDGDVIQKIGGRTIGGARRATRILRSYEPGEDVEMEVLRHKRRKTITFKLPERSREWTRGQLLFQPFPQGHRSSLQSKSSRLPPKTQPDAQVP